jgi:PAS domain S-box-containing protein
VKSRAAVSGTRGVGPIAAGCPQSNAADRDDDASDPDKEVFARAAFCRLVALLDSDDPASCDTDLAGRVTGWSGGAERLLGYRAEEVIGRRVGFVDPEARPRLRELTARIVGDDTIVRSELELVDRQGTHLRAILSASAIRTADGEAVTGVSMIFHSALAVEQAEEALHALNAYVEHRVRTRTEHCEGVNAELRASNAELAEANRRLDEATRAKSTFLASMSHELRTPLTSILGFAGTLLMGLAGPLEEEQRRQIEMISTSGKHLLDLINQVLDLARIEDGGVHVEIEPTPIRPLVLNALDAIRPLCAAKGLEAKMSCPAGVGAITTDGTRVEQILLNLLSNAVKCTERGGVSIEARRTKREVVIAVEDTGCGLVSDDIDRIFDRFCQAGSPGENRDFGTGLGLSISRGLAEMLGGGITVTSEPGSGSTFRVHLPLDGPVAQ